MKIILIKILHSLTRNAIKKYKPKVVAITGSVGKTATKEAIFSVLSKKLNARRNVGNYNTEIGLPLTILGIEKAPGKNPFAWLGIYFHALGMILSKKDYPEVLILEMGADKPGDIEELVKIAPPYIGIITAITPAHTEMFKSISGVAREKGKIFKSIKKEGWIIVNYDDKEVAKIASTSIAQKIGYSINSGDEINVCASEIAVSKSDKTSTGILGISFKLHTNGTVTPIILKDVLGEHQVYPALAASGVAQALGLHMVDVAEGLESLTPQPGRMRILEGIKHTVLIDDTYNASPVAVERAIEALVSVKGKAKKYAVLGDMLELGSMSEEEHKKLGRFASKQNIDVLITVGERARDIARGAQKAGMNQDSIFEFDTTDEAGRFVQSRMEKGDIILVKGSRGMGMEDVVREIMAQPQKANELLVH
jgi:UDP-N-acetylmuramoyl-tripeptide--D-alanyl-D-alanine ligase